jgi:creatinine amidohydrolase/Fe(II)-dependent formamide hydrolase-like protein
MTDKKVDFVLEGSSQEFREWNDGRSLRLLQEALPDDWTFTLDMQCWRTDAGERAFGWAVYLFDGDGIAQFPGSLATDGTARATVAEAADRCREALG